MFTEYINQLQRQIATLTEKRRQQESSLQAMETKLRLNGHGEPCYYCSGTCNSLLANPNAWPIPLCHEDAPGAVKYHHVGCVTARLKRVAELETKLREAEQRIEQLNVQISEQYGAWQVHYIKEFGPYIEAHYEDAVKDKLAELETRAQQAEQALSELKAACLELREGTGCFCEYPSSHLTDYPMKDHTSECKRLEKALEGTVDTNSSAE